MKRVAIALATLLTAGLAFVPGEASARMGGFHGGFHGGGFHGMAFRGGFGPRFASPAFHRGFVHPGFGFRHRRFFPGAALGFGVGLAAGSAFYGGYYPSYYDCYLQRRWTWSGPVLVRVCY